MAFFKNAFDELARSKCGVDELFHSKPALAVDALSNSARILLVFLKEDIVKAGIDEVRSKVAPLERRLRNVGVDKIGPVKIVSGKANFLDLDLTKVASKKRNGGMGTAEIQIGKERSLEALVFT